MVNTNLGNVNYELIGDDTYQVLNHSIENDINFKIYGYKKSKKNLFVYHFIAIILCGIPYIVFKWYPQLKTIKYQKCPLGLADFVLLKDNYNHNIVLQIYIEFTNIPEYTQVRYFIYQNVKYVWINDDTQFTSLKIPVQNLTLNSLHENSLGVTKEEQHDALKLYGLNIITVEVKSYCQLFIDEVFNPFYLFQIFSIGLWSCDEYYIYAGCILFLSIVSIATSLYETKKQSIALHNLVESSNCSTAQVCRPKITKETTCDEQNQFDYETVDTALLVPNDLIVLPSDGCTMPCDAVILNGLCIVNESMLTGESVPVTKTPPNHCDEVYNVDLHKRHTIFAGTHVIQTRFYGGSKVLARVVRTGFSTSKGELIKSILYPKPTGLKFYRDSMKFVLFLSIIATVGMAYCVYLYAERKAKLEEIFIRALDIITIVVPPALPAAMTVGTIYSQNRLRKNNIFCISPPRINVCGKLKLICFDKTGTLTQDGLEFYGVIPSVNNKFEDFIQEPHTLDQNSNLLQAMATCHSLTRIDNVLTGDPLDIGMFEATKWDLEEPGNECTRYDMLTPTVVKPKLNLFADNIPVEELINIQCEIGILRQFPFSSSQQCMSVICRVLGARNMIVFTKGAPEKIQGMCSESSLPSDFSTVLSNYTTSGYRVIALAFKQMPKKFSWREAQKIKRETIECELHFLGFIIMQNALKPETTPIINELHAAKIRTVMVTGDNIMTAISVSRDCGMVLPNENIILLKECSEIVNGQIPKLSVEILGSPHQHQQNGDCILNIQNSSRVHIAVDGRTWLLIRNHYPDLVSRIVLHGTIFARFRPDQKTQLVTSLQELDYIVGMCGDGANDCGALKAADIGVSLSQAEASVAAPFTSSTQNISCIKHLVSEGRCSLVTSFAVFKYMAMYSLIQFFTVLILYKRYTTLGNMQFLYIDLIITTSLAITMGYQGPANYIVSKRPMGSLISLVNIIPLLLQILLCGVIQYGALFYLTLQPWFEPLVKNSYVDEEVIVCWENTIVFSVSCYQYVILACVYSKGHPYRQSILSNGLLLLTAVLLIAFTTLLLVYPIEPLAKYFEMIPATLNYDIFLFRSEILIFPVMHFILAVLIDFVLGERRCLKSIAHCLTRKKCPKNKYKRINQICDINTWLDICSHSPYSIYC